MRARIWTLAVGLLASAHVGAADPKPTIAPPPAALPAAAAPAQPGAVPAAPIPALPPGVVPVAPTAVPCPAPIVVQGQGCAACTDKAARGSKSAGVFGSLRIGAGCAMPVGCSNLQAEKNFFFGSCRQFFTPGNDCGPRAGRCGTCGETCGGVPGPGPCHTGGGSYLNR